MVLGWVMRGGGTKQDQRLDQSRFVVSGVWWMQYSDSILLVALLYCIHVFGDSFLQSPPSFANVHIVTFTTGNFIDHSFPF